MECEQILNLMMQVLDGEASPEGQATLQEHLTCCTPCRVRWEQLRALEQLLQAPPERPSLGFAGRVMARLDYRQRARRGVMGGFVLAAGAAVVALLLVAPPLLALPGLFESLPTFYDVVSTMAFGLADTASVVINTLGITVEALLVPLAMLALCGAGMALAANLLWLALIRRIQLARTAR